MRTILREVSSGKEASAKRMADSSDPVELLLDAALLHVVFDGWSEATFEAAISETEIDPALARALCPRGAADLALAYHRRGDRLMLLRLAEEDLTGYRFRDIEFRIPLVAHYTMRLQSDYATEACPPTTSTTTTTFLACLSLPTSL